MLMIIFNTLDNVIHAISERQQMSCRIGEIVNLFLRHNVKHTKNFATFFR